jgi:hypothetical protein
MSPPAVFRIYPVTAKNAVPLRSSGFLLRGAGLPLPFDCLKPTWGSL